MSLLVVLKGRIVENTYQLSRLHASAMLRQPIQRQQPKPCSFYSFPVSPASVAVMAHLVVGVPHDIVVAVALRILLAVVHHTVVVHSHQPEESHGFAVHSPDSHRPT